MIIFLRLASRINCARFFLSNSRWRFWKILVHNSGIVSLQIRFFCGDWFILRGRRRGLRLLLLLLLVKLVSCVVKLVKTLVNSGFESLIVIIFLIFCVELHFAYKLSCNDLSSVFFKVINKIHFFVKDLDSHLNFFRLFFLSFLFISDHIPCLFWSQFFNFFY